VIGEAGEGSRILSQRELPVRLYHYTNRTGLVGISTDRTLWATDIRFLDDTSEVRYSRELLRDRAVHLQPELDTEYGGHVSGLAARILADALTIPQTYVASLCEEGDNLTLWQSYGDRGHGFALGFGRLRLYEAAQAFGYNLLPIMYDPLEQAAHCDQAIREAAEIVDGWGRDSNAPSAPLQALLLGYAFTIVTWQIKNPAFRDQREWRLERMDLPDQAPRTIRSRLGIAGETPFEDVRLDVSGDFPLEEVVLGPLADCDETEMRGLLDEWRLHDVTVRTSTVPLRA